MKRPFGDYEVNRLWEDAKYGRGNTVLVPRETVLDFVALYRKVRDERDAALTKCDGMVKALQSKVKAKASA